MDRIVSYCGLICNHCPVFIATENNDFEQKVKLSHEYSSPRYSVGPEEINCTGCYADSKVIFKFCRECEIRICGIEKAKENCAHCQEYPCSKLDIPFKNSPENKKILDSIKERLCR